MDLRSWIWNLLLVGVLGGSTAGDALAAGGRLKAQIKGSGPAASAAEIPALAQLLEKAGWTPTPELSGVFKAGSIFKDDGTTHSLMVRNCFDQVATQDTYTSMELVSQLQAGVRVRSGLFGARASGELVKKVKFGAPIHHTLERLGMDPTAACQAMLAKVSASEQDQMYVVQEVLTAEIAEQTCGRVDADGRFVGLGSAELELSQACMQESLEPVAVAYRVVPVADLDVTAAAAPVNPQPPVVPTGCPWGDIRTVSTTMKTLTVNGQVIDVRGLEQRGKIMDIMQRCGRPAAASAFDNWRRWRRTANISGATIVGYYPFSVGMVASFQAGKWRPYMEKVLLDPSAALPLEGALMPGPKKLRRMAHENQR